MGMASKQVETLALRDAFDDVDEDDIAQLFGGDPVSGGGAYVSRTNNGDFIAHESPF